jgi:two-component system, cell cycle response regulator
MLQSSRRIVLIDPDAETRVVYAARLRSQDFAVDEAKDAVSGAEMALAAPPAAVVSDLWMPGVSGVQLCRLLKAEPGTADVPVILRAEQEDPYSRFWATRAGASSLVSKDRMGDLMRALAVATARPVDDDAFFFQMSGGMDVRDRIAQHLDRALFDSVIAAEVRALASACSFDRLFDSLSQLLAQLVTYRWMALTTKSGDLAVHAHRRCADSAEAEVRAALEVPERTKALRILDADAAENVPCDRVIVLDVLLGDAAVGRLAFSVPPGESQVDAIAPIAARELGGPIRLAVLVEESQRLATTDGLTSLLNRRAFGETMDRELSRCDRLGTPASLLLLDLDHFKVINDSRGHAAGDAVLAAIGKLLKAEARGHDVIARWGGEEFVIALPGADQSGGIAFAERIRKGIEELVVHDATGAPIPLTASIGVAERQSHEALDVTVDRADRAMYCAKIGGRNRICVAEAVAVAIEEVPVPASGMASAA